MDSRKVKYGFNLQDLVLPKSPYLIKFRFLLNAPGARKKSRLKLKPGPTGRRGRGRRAAGGGGGGETKAELNNRVLNSDDGPDRGSTLDFSPKSALLPDQIPISIPIVAVFSIPMPVPTAVLLPILVPNPLYYPIRSQSLFQS
ncbi:hypothetical protein EVAR_6843_1 [Eumeta japonica]|uniref:Uncharacterized protein n=1 Tax=Eumeta variegata TaxID=151549 RepID=A0A4C1U6D0_EUMVA|nr:hypothetical protein EVAR_6843_1 [Eumeta japonica]